MSARARAVLVSFACLWPTGCMVADASREMWKATSKALTPDPGGYQDGIDEVDQQWSSWDKQASGLRPMEQNGDPWLSSKARQIERNLGVE